MTPARADAYRVYQRKWRDANPDYGRTWRAENADKRKAAMTEWSTSPSGRASQAKRQKRYREKHRERIAEKNARYFRSIHKGLVLKRKESALGRARPDKCEVCDGNDTKLGIVFDHCHATGKARGWLCSKCNSALGLLGDDPQRLRALANYLEAFARDSDGAGE